MTCKSKKDCTKCRDGYFFNKADIKCEVCPIQSCYECSTKKLCAKCKPFYEPVENQCKAKKGYLLTIGIYLCILTVCFVAYWAGLFFTCIFVKLPNKVGHGHGEDFHDNHHGTYDDYSKSKEQMESNIFLNSGTDFK